MDARFYSALLALVAVLSCGAGRPYYSVRSQFFIVSAPTPQLAEEICQAAETFRRDLAIEWLGRELPPWREPCPIQANVSPQLGAGGVTSFMFDRGTPFGWTMEVQGTRERVLDSVLPHEITHTIFATHFGRPLPRWADEGACTTVESEEEKRKQDKFLVQFLKTDRGIPFNKMFAMREYPPDILPLYSQGYSLARYLIQQGGKPKFVEFVGEGMQTNNWTATTSKYYGFRSLSELQVTWLAWVGQGSPNLPQNEGLAQNSDSFNRDPEGSAPVGQVSASESGVPLNRIAAMPAPPATQMESIGRRQQVRENAAQPEAFQEISRQNDRQLARDQQFTRPNPPTTFGAEQYAEQQQPGHSSVSRPVSEGWYAKRRDQAQSILHSSAVAPQQTQPQQSFTVPAPPTRAMVPQELSPASTFGQPPAAKATPSAPPGNRRVLLEWSRQFDPAATPGRTGDLSGVAMLDGGLSRR